MFERPSKSGGSSERTSCSYSFPIVTQLQPELQTTQTELQTTQSQLDSTKEELSTTREQLDVTKQQLNVTRKQLDDQRISLLELNARFDSFSAMLEYPTTHGSNFLDSS